MSISKARRFVMYAALVMSFTQAGCADDIFVADAKSQPESLTVAPGWRADRGQRQFAVRL